MLKLIDLKRLYFHTAELTILKEIVVPTCTFKLLLNLCVEKIFCQFANVYIPNNILFYKFCIDEKKRHTMC